MENILDLLYEYSKRGKNVDKKFIDKVIKVMIREKDLNDYIKRVRFKNLSICKINHGGKDTPMAYNTYTKEILIDNNNIILFQKMLEELIQFRDFEQVLSINTMLIQALLHEIEHANQLKKSIIRNEEFENLLLSVSCHVDNEFFKESKISQLLILKKGIYLNSQLYHNLGLQEQLNTQFKTSLPIERMANIHSAQEVNGMLVEISKNECIENVTSLFDSLLAGFQLKGYNFNTGLITSPTENYLEEVKKLNIIGMDKHFTEYFDTVMKKAQSTSLENRLLLGLDINEEEYQKTKKKLSKKLR